MSETLVVVGLGYVGLPLAQAACTTNLKVVGFDLNQEIVNGLNNGTSHIDDLSDDDISVMLSRDFIATTDSSCITKADVVVVCVPTPLSDEGGPDLNAVIGASRAIAKHLRPGMMVVLESTTYPGTTDEVVRPILEESGFYTEDIRTGIWKKYYENGQLDELINYTTGQSEKYERDPKLVYKKYKN